MEEPVFIKCEPEINDDSSSEEYGEPIEDQGESALELGGLVFGKESPLFDEGSHKAQECDHPTIKEELTSLAVTEVKDDPSSYVEVLLKDGKDESSGTRREMHCSSSSCIKLQENTEEAAGKSEHKILSATSDNQFVCQNDLTNCTLMDKPQVSFKIAGHTMTDNHMQTTTEGTMCSSLKSGSSSTINIKFNLKDRIEKKLYFCQFCSRSFNNNSNLHKHERIHTGEKPFTCEVCNRSFTLRSTFVKHQRTHTGERPFFCGLCNRSFSDRSYLSLHQRIHSGEKPYSCDVCDRSFSDRRWLRKHQTTHTGEKPYPCDVCGRHFARISTMRIHRRTHTGEKPYSCSSCDRSFNQRNCLTVHERTHTGERPYACDHCSRSFCDKSTYDRHLRTHTGERPYSCEVCNRSFTDRSNLQKHRKVHAEEK